MIAYEALAASYDRLTKDIPYNEMLEFIETVLHRSGKYPKTVLDLACGTGSMSVLLAQHGYCVTGCDLSEPMLTQAAQKAALLSSGRPVFVRQPMQKLSLPEPVDCAVCCLDSINYLAEPEDCREAFRRVFRNLVPGGVFIFDINTPNKLRSLDGQIFLDEDDDTYCVWRAEFSREENRIYYGIDLFRRENAHWNRYFEEHREFAYAPEDLLQWLGEVGFSRTEQFGDLRLSRPEMDEQRIYIAAYKE